MHTTALVLFSGGQDSTTCLAHALSRFERVETVGFDYGQRHHVEMTARLTVRHLVGWNERKEFLQTVFYEARRAGLDPGLDPGPGGASPALRASGIRTSVPIRSSGVTSVVTAAFEKSISGIPDPLPSLPVTAPAWLP